MGALEFREKFSTKMKSFHSEENSSPKKILESDEISRLRINHSLDGDTELNKKLTNMTRPS